MILDATELFSDGQAVTVTAISENVIDLGTMGTVQFETAPMALNLGAGCPKLPLLVQATETFTGLTSLQVSLETADDAGLTTNAEVLVQSGVVLAADLVAGWKPGWQQMPVGNLRQFIGLRYTVAGTATAGAITAGFTMGIDAGYNK